MSKNTKNTSAAEVTEAYRARSNSDFLLFAKGLVIASSAGPALFKNCIQPFQTECFELMAPSLHALRDGDIPPKRRFWIERTKKSSKDGDLAVCLLWLTAFAVRPFLVQICAANQKQAGIIKRRVADLLYYNSWLNDFVKIQLNRLLSQNGLAEVIIESTDAAGGAHGETPDLLILNELVHVSRWTVMDTHMNNADGVPRGIVIVSTNAGVKGTKAHKWRRNAILSDKWTTCVWNKKAPWLNDDDVEEARRRDPVGSEFRRLWQGVWVSGSGDALDEATIDHSFTLKGPLESKERGWSYLAGLDLGISHDHAGVSVIGVNTIEQKIKLAYFKKWIPKIPNDKGQNEVNLAMVEFTCVKLWKIFSIDWFGYDPAAGGSFMAQRLRRQGVPMRERSFASSQNMTDMAQAFVQVMKEGKLACYDDEEGNLRRDFSKFTIIHRPPSAYKLEAISDEYGHADVGISVIIALPQAVERLAYWDGLCDTDTLYEDDNGRELTEEEIEMMPLEMLEVYQDPENMGGNEDFIDYNEYAGLPD